MNAILAVRIIAELTERDDRTGNDDGIADAVVLGRCHNTTHAVEHERKSDQHSKAKTRQRGVAEPDHDPYATEPPPKVKAAADRRAEDVRAWRKHIRGVDQSSR